MLFNCQSFPPTISPLSVAALSRTCVSANLTLLPFPCPQTVRLYERRRVESLATLTIRQISQNHVANSMPTIAETHVPHQISIEKAISSAPAVHNGVPSGSTTRKPDYSNQWHQTRVDCDKRESIRPRKRKRPNSERRPCSNQARNLTSSSEGSGAALCAIT